MKICKGGAENVLALGTLAITVIGKVIADARRECHLTRLCISGFRITYIICWEAAAEGTRARTLARWIPEMRGPIKYLRRLQATGRSWQKCAHVSHKGAHRPKT